MNSQLRIGLAITVGFAVAVSIIFAVLAVTPSYANSPSGVMRGFQFAEGIDRHFAVAMHRRGEEGPMRQGGALQDTLRISVLSRVSSVKVTSVSIIGDNKVELIIAYNASGNPPAVTVLAMAGKLTGSNVTQSWSSPSTVTLTLTGDGSLSDTRRIVLFIAPFTG